MLISKMRGEGDEEGDGEGRGDVPPPGTEPPRQRAPAGEIYRPPVMYTKGPDGNHGEFILSSCYCVEKNQSSWYI